MFYVGFYVGFVTEATCIYTYGFCVLIWWLCAFEFVIVFCWVKVRLVSCWCLRGVRGLRCGMGLHS